MSVVEEGQRNQKEGGCSGFVLQIEGVGAIWCFGNFI